MKFNFFGALSILLLMGACAEDISDPVGPQASGDEIPNTGVEVNFSANLQEPQIDEQTAKLYAEWNVVDGNPETRVRYTPDGTPDQDRSLSLQWQNGDRVSFIQVAERADGTVISNTKAKGTITAYTYNASTTDPSTTTGFAAYNPHVTGADGQEVPTAEFIMKWYANSVRTRFFSIYPALSENGTVGIKTLIPYTTTDGKLDATKLAKVVIRVPKDQWNVYADASYNASTGLYSGGSTPVKRDGWFAYKLDSKYIYP